MSDQSLEGELDFPEIDDLDEDERLVLSIEGFEGPLDVLLILARAQNEKLAGALLMPIALVLPEFLGSWLGKNIANLILLNCLLAVLNMLPLPPLDGGKVAHGLLPPHLARRYGRIAPYGIFILVGIVFILPMLGRPLGLNLNIGRYLIFEPSYALANWILTTFGIGV